MKNPRESSGLCVSFFSWENVNTRGGGQALFISPPFFLLASRSSMKTLLRSSPPKVSLSPSLNRMIQAPTVDPRMQSKKLYKHSGVRTVVQTYPLTSRCKCLTSGNPPKLWLKKSWRKRKSWEVCPQKGLQNLANFQNCRILWHHLQFLNKPITQL